MSLSTFKRILAQLIMGPDATSAIMLCAVSGIIFGIRPDMLHAVAYLAIAWLSAHAPDLDIAPYLIIKRRWRGLKNHWQIGHHPLLLIPLAGIVGWGLTASIPWLGEPRFVAVLAAACTTAHFIHDSVPPQGLHWFSPFSWQTHVTFASGFPKLVSSALFEEHELRYQAQVKEFGIVTASLEGVSMFQRLYWVVAVALISFWCAR